MNAFISEQPSRARLFDERRNDGVSVRGEERSRKRYAVRDDEVCVPYKRKPVRLNRRAAAPAASATVNAKTVTIRAFDGRTQHRLELLLRVISIRQFYDYPSTVRTSFARVFHRGTPGVRSLQEERHNTYPLDTEKSW